MSTETNAATVKLGPDWLRNKPVFSKHRYGQEELLGLWACSEPCPESLCSELDLKAPDPLQPVSITQYTAEEKDSYQNRSLTSDRGRGRGRASTRGTRRGYDSYTSRYYDTRDNSRSADSDNWRRRDPTPDNDPTTPPTDPPPYYPPFPPKISSPPSSSTIIADNKENNSWKRREEEGSPEEMLRSISQSLQAESNEQAFGRQMFGDTSGASSLGMFNSAPGNLSSLPTNMNSMSSFGRQPSNISPPGNMNPPGNISSQIPSIPLSASMTSPSLFKQDNTSPSQHFPSLSEIGNSLQSSVQVSQQQDVILGQGFMPPLPTSVYRADELWYYLDPKGNTQGPFDSVKMFSWFREGYFGMDLEIRSATVVSFAKLETMITQCGRVPFQPDDNKGSPPPGNMPNTSAWNPTTTITQGIWGNTEPAMSTPLGDLGAAFPSLTPNIMNGPTKAQRAEEMRKEIERAMAVEQQRKQHEIESDERKRNEQMEKDHFLNEQQRMIQAKLNEEQLKKESEMMRFREEEMMKNKIFEEETERIRMEKERLERDRIAQEERVRIELENADRARRALAEERLKLEKERELIKRQEEELGRRAEAERLRQENEDKSRLADEQRQAAQKAAAEAKAIASAQREAKARAQEEAKAAAIKAVRREVEAKEAANRNVWGPVPSTSPSNPWANINPAPQMTNAATRTPMATAKGWGSLNNTPVPLSQIQRSEIKSKGPSYTPKKSPQQTLGIWETPSLKPQNTKSLADIQREEEQWSSQHHNYTNARQNDWNPVAGMLEEDQPRPKPTLARKGKPAPKPAAKQPKQAKQQAAPLLDMFSAVPSRDEFTIWCEKQVASFNNKHIDVPTFISFLRDVESPVEVREYVVSYLGDNKSTDDFIKEFVSRRKSAKQTADMSDMGFEPIGKKEPKPQQPPTSRKGKRKKMQKINAASLLGINCTASSDARNRGDIDTVVIQ